MSFFCHLTILSSTFPTLVNGTKLHSVTQELNLRFLHPSHSSLHIQVTRLLLAAAGVWPSPSSPCHLSSTPRTRAQPLSTIPPAPPIRALLEPWEDPLLKQESDHRVLLLIRSWVTYPGPLAGKRVLLSSAKSGVIHQAAIEDKCIWLRALCPNRRQRLSVLSLEPLEDKRPS